MKDLAPGVQRLFGLPPNAVNVYLVEDVLIDAASRLASRRILRQIIDRPVSMVALTHVHPDHQGAAHAVCEARGIPLACHTDGVAEMQGDVPPASNGRISAAITRAFSGPPHPVARPFAEGDVIAGFNVIHAPGHAPSEVIFFRESDRIAICGDVINTMDLRTGLPRVQEPPHALSLDPILNRESIRKLAALEPALVLPGHGAPLRDPSKLKRLASSF